MKTLKTINLNRIARESGIDYQKIVNNLNGKYNSLTRREKIRIAKAIYTSVKPILKRLGIQIMLVETHNRILNEQVNNA